MYHRVCFVGVHVHGLQSRERPTVFILRDDARISRFIFQDKKFDVGAHAWPRWFSLLCVSARPA